jgi:spermidine synthase
MTPESPVTSIDATRAKQPAVGRTAIFAVLFVLSGACALTYQVVWSRFLAEIFGVTAFAVSTVLVSFMGGMALGAYWLGTRVDRAARPLRIFAALEAGIGAYALVLPLLLAGAGFLYDTLFPALPDSFLLKSAIRFVMSLALLLFPTILMGGTLPALGRGLLQRKDRVGLAVGLLYFVNTLGAAVGCFLAGFWLLPHLGLTGTTRLAVAFNFLVGATAYFVDRRDAPAAVDPAASQSGAASADAAPLTEPASWPLWVAFGSGFAALAFEVIWFRVLVLVFGSTVYSFAAMLSVFLLGLAIGSAVLGPWSDRTRAPVRLLALAQAGVAICALAGSLSVNHIPLMFLRSIRDFGITYEGMTLTKLLLSFVTILPPALAFGGTFPVVVRLAAALGRGTGASIGQVYTWNTAGAILGAFLTGFVLLPSAGTEITLKLVIGVSICMAFGSLLVEPGRLNLRWAAPAGALIVVLVVVLVMAPPWDRRLLGCGVYFEPRTFIDPQGGVSVGGVLADYHLMTYTEGYNETTTSFESPKGKFITVNGSPSASDQFEDMFVHRMLGHLPIFFHAGPVKRVGVIGLGAGVTAGALGLHDIERLTTIELEKGVLVASRFFEDNNDHVLDNPHLDLRIDDGRNFLRLSRDKFDVISSHANFPSVSGSGALFSKDYLEQCKAHLAPGGIMGHWAPLWRTRPEDWKTAVATFTDVFPHVRVFTVGLTTVLLGRVEPFPPVDLAELRARFAWPGVAQSLQGIGVRGPIEVLSYYQMDEAEARRLSAGAPRTTDDRPILEFEAPRAAFEETVVPNLTDIRGVRPSREERADRLGLSGEDRDAFLTLSKAYDDARDGEMLLYAGRPDEAFAKLIPIADSGQRYACYLVAERAARGAQVLQQAGKLDEAREQFLLTLRYDPQRLEALVGVGYLDLFNGKLDEADVMLSRAVELYPRSAGAVFRLGAVRQEQGRLAEAERLYRQAIAQAPTLGGPRGLLGGLLLARGDAKGALELFDGAVALGEASEGVIAGRAEAKRRLSQP